MARLRQTSSLVKLLREQGLLLQQDRSLPNVVNLVLDETLSTSWWSHPRAEEVLRCLSELADHPDVLLTKLVRGKVTFVHRSLWPALLAVATAQERWQFHRLPAAARTLHAKVEALGEAMAAGKPARELERRLLVHGEQVHTAAGHHEMRLESWQNWAGRIGYKQTGPGLSAAAGRKRLENAVRAIGGKGGELPWQS
jgi:hypothetical protein